MGLEELTSRFRNTDAIDQRMAHIIHLHAPLGVEVLLKRKDHQHAVNGLLHLFHPTAAPSPHLRADQVEHGNAERLQFYGQPKIEVRKVQQDCQRAAVWPALRSPAVAALNKDVPVRHGFKGTQYCQPVDIDDGFDATFPHALSATTKELEGPGRNLSQQVRDELRGIHVAGSFSGNDENRLGL